MNIVERYRLFTIESFFTYVFRYKGFMACPLPVPIPGPTVVLLVQIFNTQAKLILSRQANILEWLFIDSSIHESERFVAEIV